ncbi:hypothetical protein D3C84_535980 [compost metagenome]
MIDHRHPWEIRHHYRSTPEHLGQLPLAVVAVGKDGGPNIFIKVVGALGHQVTLARLQGGLNYPDAMKFPANLIRIQVMIGKGVFCLRCSENLVAVIGDIHLLLADQLPVEAIEATGIEVHIIESHDAGGSRLRRVTAGVR